MCTIRRYYDGLEHPVPRRIITPHPELRLNADIETRDGVRAVIQTDLCNVARYLHRLTLQSCTNSWRRKSANPFSIEDENAAKNAMALL